MAMKYCVFQLQIKLKDLVLLIYYDVHENVIIFGQIVLYYLYGPNHADVE